MKGKYSNPISRWEGIGPYYAMFPTTFARGVIAEYTKKGDAVLDPFAGRGTSIFAAATMNRHGLGVEINPVGWVYSRAKLSPAKQDEVIKRLFDLEKITSKYKKKIDSLPDFFHHCYHPDVLQFLLAARDNLNWRNSKPDATLMALILVNLHGKYGNALSNQMRQTKAMSPNYAIQWWKRKGIKPPKINPKDFMLRRIAWRYRHGIPDLEQSITLLGDSSKMLLKIGEKSKREKINRPKLLFTSPPYLGVTNYHYDQWLRLWMLGYPPSPSMLKDRYKRKFGKVDDYAMLLRKVFEKSAALLHRDAVIYVRTDQRPACYEMTKSILLKVFPDKKLIEKAQPFSRPTQTKLFWKKTKNNSYAVQGGEIDLIMVPA
jgi:hypothetical protein